MKLRAATLIESIVALTIISIVFGVSILIFLSVTTSGNLNEKIAAHEFIQKMVTETKTENKYFEETANHHDIEFTKTVIQVNDRRLIRLSIRADKNGKTIEHYNEFIISDEEN